MRHTVLLLIEPAPEVLGFTCPHQETRSLDERLHYYLGSGFEPRAVAIFTRARSALAEQVLPSLELRGVKGVMLSDDAPPKRAYVSLGAMFRVKDFEFRIVVVVGCDAALLPLAAAQHGLTGSAARSAFFERAQPLLCGGY